MADSAVVKANAARLRRRAGLTAPVFLVLLSCLVAPGGLISHHWPGDVIYYSHVGAKIAHGNVPYHDFYLEYPPGAIPVFAIPALISQHHYVLLFKLLMTVFAVVAVAAGVRVVTDPSLRRTGLVLGLAPLAMGPLFFDRYDVFPAALVAVAVLALVKERPRVAAVLLALAVVAKIYAIALVPIAAVHIARRWGRRELARTSAIFVGVGLLCTLPFAAIGFGGLGYSFYIQATRHLQVESLGAQLLVALHHLGFYHATVFIGKPGSFDLRGALPNAVGVISSLVEVAVVLLVAVWYARGSTDSQRLVLGCAAAVTAYVALGKVLSPQYLIWLLLLVPLVEAGIGWTATIVVLAAVVMTQIGFYHQDGIANLSGVSWLVLARDIVLLVLLAVLVRPLRRAIA